MNKPTQNLENYILALHNRIQKLGARSVFYKLPSMQGKLAKSGDPTAFCDLPHESQRTLEIENKCSGYFVGCYNRGVTVEDLKEDLEFFASKFTVLGV